ncbi:MAG: hypothetical protein K0S65_5603 [Labilithrix sp.]|nr:hypothetical protein [Labilithrix sp.]
MLLVTVVGLLATAAWLGRRFPEAGATEGRPRDTPRERVRVEVLNAGGVPGVAADARDLLRESGFDVVEWGNAPSFDRDTTVVVDRVGREDLAGAVANALGIRNVLVEPDPNLFVDVSVLLGRDWVVRSGETERFGSTPDRPPWDPREWLGP